MTERRGAGRAALAVALCLAIVLAGCSTAWIAQAEEIVAALIPAAANLIGLVAALQGKTVSAADLQTIENAGTQAGADLQLIQSLITAYEQADAASQPGIMNQIESTINAAQSNLQGLLAGLHIKDAATQAKITAVVGILLSEVQSLAAIVPLVNPNSPSSASLLAKKSPVKAPLSANEFVASYNATMTAKTGNAQLDQATGRFKIHLHGTAARWATAGALK